MFANALFSRPGFFPLLYNFTFLQFISQNFPKYLFLFSFCPIFESFMFVNLLETGYFAEFSPKPVSCVQECRSCHYGCISSHKALEQKKLRRIIKVASCCCQLKDICGFSTAFNCCYFKFCLCKQLCNSLKGSIYLTN